MMKKYIKPNVVSVATISEGCLLAGTNGGDNGGVKPKPRPGGHAKEGSVLKPSCKSILLSTQFHKYLLPLHHEESPIITLHLSRCTCRLL